MNLLLDPLAPDLTPVLETALDAVVIMRADGLVAEWNGVAEQIFGWSREQAVGQQLSALIIPERFRDAHHRGLLHYLATGEGPVLNRHFEISALNAAGEEFPVELSITPTQSGGVTLFLGFLRDIRERKTAEETIRRRAVEAEAIAGLTALAAEGNSFDLVMEACLRAVCGITGWTLGHAWCCPSDDPAALVDTGIWFAPDARDFEPLVTATEAIAFRSGVGLPGKSLQRLAPVWMSEVDSQHDFPRAEAASAAGLLSAFAFPIQSGSRPIAVLEFFHDVPTQPDPALWPTLQTLGEQVGRVFERVHAAELLNHEREALLAEIERRKALEGRQQLLLNELNHRVKNILAVVGGIAHQTGKNSTDIPGFLGAFSGRLTALATAHSLLTREQWESAPLGDLIAELV
ncbi:MAG: PAS domain S-box protein, partial [Sphingomicrobium sp.]